jgi:hypothetical protein
MTTTLDRGDLGSTMLGAVFGERFQLSIHARTMCNATASGGHRIRASLWRLTELAAHSRQAVS